MDYKLLGKALENFEQNWCQNTKCKECPFATKEEGGACMPVNMGRFVAHHKFLIECLGVDEKEAYDKIFEFESDKEHTEMEKSKLVRMITMMATTIGDDFTE